jgi:hypothetical protein
MTDADLDGILGDLGLGNMTEDDLDGILGDLGFGNATDTDLGGLLGGMLGTIASEASGSSNKFTTAIFAWAFAGSYMAFVLV